MANYYFKKKVKDLKRSRAKIFGPLNADGSLPKGHKPQPLNFSLQNGTVAKCDLQPGKRYDVVVDMHGERGGSFTASVQPSDLSRQFEDAFKAEIPTAWSEKPTLLGYQYTDIPRFTVKGIKA